MSTLLAPVSRSRSRPAFTGPVQMLGDHWVAEQKAWLHAIARARGLDKRAVLVGIELALAVDREPGSRDQGFAVRSLGWLATKVGGTENNIGAAISALKNRGLIEVESRKHLGRANRYRLLFPDAAASFGPDDFRNE